jgi:hypothetical protein
VAVLESPAALPFSVDEAVDVFDVKLAIENVDAV